MPQTQHDFFSTLKLMTSLLQTTGLKQGQERFTEFAKLLFLRLMGLKPQYRLMWQKIAEANKEHQMPLINQALINFNRQYGLGNYGKTLNLDAKHHQGALKEIINHLNTFDFLTLQMDFKGYAFEYFLNHHQRMTNDLGEYFTPRHLADFMARLLDPKPGETVYDPFCGSGGLLTATLNYVLKTKKLTYAQEKKLRQQTAFGTDINDVADIAKMNFILKGFNASNVCLQPEGSLLKPRTEQYDLVIANIPFNLSLKHQIKTLKMLYPCFDMNGNDICLEHIIDALKPTLNARACVIVPDQFLFHRSLKSIRKYLLNHFEIKVFSLPEGVFAPFTNCKTSLLLLKYTKKPSTLTFIRLFHLGFTLDRFQTPIPHNDLETYFTNPKALETYKLAVNEVKNQEYLFRPLTFKNPYAAKIKLKAILTLQKPSETLLPDQKYSEITIKQHGQGIYRRRLKDQIIWTLGKDFNDKRSLLADGDFIISDMQARHGAFGKIPEAFKPDAVCSHTYHIFKVTKEFKDFDLDLLTTILNHPLILANMNALSRGSDGRKRLLISDFLNLALPFTKDELLALNKTFKPQINLTTNLKLTASKLQKTLEAQIIDLWQQKLTVTKAFDKGK